MPLNMRIQVKTKRKRKPTKLLVDDYKKLVRNTLRSIGMKGVNNIRSEIKKRNLVKTSEMYDSVTFRMTPQGVNFKVDSPANYLESGVKPHQMRYLMKSKRPIPIPVDAINTLFRFATPKSMAEGKWMHPGFTRGKDFFKTSVKRTRKDAEKQFKNIGKKVFK